MYLTRAHKCLWFWTFMDWFVSFPLISSHRWDRIGSSRSYSWMPCSQIFPVKVQHFWDIRYLRFGCLTYSCESLFYYFCVLLIASLGCIGLTLRTRELGAALEAWPAGLYGLVWSYVYSVAVRLACSSIILWHNYKYAGIKFSLPFDLRNNSRKFHAIDFLAFFSYQEY